MGKLSSDTQNSLGYSINTDGYINYFSLPYTSANVVSQKFASRTVNLNPFSVTKGSGTLTISPNVDNWVDTSYLPALLVNDPALTLYTANAAVNTMVVGDWKTITGTTSTTVTRNGNIETTTSYTPITKTQQNLVGNYSKVDNTYALNDDVAQVVVLLAPLYVQLTPFVYSGSYIKLPVPISQD